METEEWKVHSGVVWVLTEAAAPKETRSIDSNDVGVKA